MLTLDDACLFRPSLDGIHGLAPGVAETLRLRFPEVQAEVLRRRGEGEYAFTALGSQDDLVDSIERFATARHRSFDHLLLLGIGSSAAGVRALVDALRPAAWNEWPGDRRDGWPTVTMLDTIDPVIVAATLDRLDPRRTLVNVVSASGDTLETLAQFLVVRRWLAQAVGEDAVAAHLVVTTRPEDGTLRRVATDTGLPCFDVPPPLGGGFSILTAAALLPAALLGIDIRAMLAGAADAVAVADAGSLELNPAARWAGLQWQAQLTRAANIQVLMPSGDRLSATADWCAQLWAGSLGRKLNRKGEEVFRGPTPVALGLSDQHAWLPLVTEGPFDKTITFFRLSDTREMMPIPAPQPGRDPSEAFDPLAGATLGELLDAEVDVMREALRAAGRMSCTITLDGLGPREFGHLVMFCQLATGYAGVWYDVDPFDRESVERGREMLRQTMAGRRAR